MLSTPALAQADVDVEETPFIVNLYTSPLDETGHGLAHFDETQVLQVASVKPLVQLHENASTKSVQTPPLRQGEEAH